MTLLAGCMVALYLIATDVAALNDRRKGRGKGLYADLHDDEKSPLAVDGEPFAMGGSIETPSPLEAPEPVATPLPINHRYDDMT